MSAEEQAEFLPNWVSAPGESITDWLECIEMSQSVFSTKMGLTPEFVENLISGSEPITDEIAENLSKVLGSTKQFWLNREKHYTDGCLRLGFLRGIN